jgi:hypothetical protein
MSLEFLHLALLPLLQAAYSLSGAVDCGHAWVDRGPLPCLHIRVVLLLGVCLQWHLNVCHRLGYASLVNNLWTQTVPKPVRTSSICMFSPKIMIKLGLHMCAWLHICKPRIAATA